MRLLRRSTRYQVLTYVYWYFLERILCVRNVGVQVKTRYLTGRLRSQFIDCSKISDIIINEGINMLQVKFYLAIIVEGQDREYVAFG